MRRDRLISVSGLQEHDNDLDDTNKNERNGETDKPKGETGQLVCLLLRVFSKTNLKCGSRTVIQVSIGMYPDIVDIFLKFA